MNLIILYLIYIELILIGCLIQCKKNLNRIDQEINSI